MAKGTLQICVCSGSRDREIILDCLDEPRVTTQVLTREISSWGSQGQINVIAAWRPGAREGRQSLEGRGKARNAIFPRASRR